DRPSRREVCALALGIGSLGARRRNADVRVWCDIERSARRHFERGCSASEDGLSESQILDFRLKTSRSKIVLIKKSKISILQFFHSPSLYIDLRMKNGFQVMVRPARNLRGNVQLPGDKSVSHRYAMLAGIAEGPSRLENYSTGADCASTLGCMRSLGVEWERKDKDKDKDSVENVIEVKGRGLALAAPAAVLDCGNSGSTMRMLSGIVAGQKFSSEMVGDESLSKRPMGRVITPLTAMGAQIASQA